MWTPAISMLVMFYIKINTMDEITCPAKNKENRRENAI